MLSASHSRGSTLSSPQVPLLHPQRFFGQPGHHPALCPAGRDAAGSECPGLPGVKGDGVQGGTHRVGPSHPTMLIPTSCPQDLPAAERNSGILQIVSRGHGGGCRPGGLPGLPSHPTVTRSASTSWASARASWAAAPRHCWTAGLCCSVWGWRCPPAHRAAPQCPLAPQHCPSACGRAPQHPLTHQRCPPTNGAAPQDPLTPKHHPPIFWGTPSRSSLPDW